MIIADSSALVSFLRRPTPHARRIIETQDPAICGCVLAELLAGARSEGERHRLQSTLGGFQSLATPETLWPNLGDNLRRLRERGIIVPFQDALIATTAIHYAVPVWTEDAHYAAMQSVLPELRLFDVGSVGAD